MLRDYEILFIARPELDEDQLGQAVGSVEKLIQNLGGDVQKTDVWGRRRLAYEVAHLREGQYVLTDFQLDPTRVAELEATLKISETVFRFLVTRKPEKAQKANGAKPAPAPAAAEQPPAVDVAEPVVSAENAEEED